MQGPWDPMHHLLVYILEGRDAMKKNGCSNTYVVKSARLLAATPITKKKITLTYFEALHFLYMGCYGASPS